MKPLILAFFMLLQCNGSENKNYESYKNQEEIELIIEEFVENLVQVVGEDNRLRVTFIGINDDGDLFIEEDVVVEDEVEEFLTELEG